jgi:hypothetical protein
MTMKAAVKPADQQVPRNIISLLTNNDQQSSPPRQLCPATLIGGLVDMLVDPRITNNELSISAQDS